MSQAAINAVIYARYSSDLQRDASIEDQIRLCQERAAAEGWKVVQCYTDHSTSGASLMRPGIQMLLQEAASGRFQVVLAEALDRVSRDQEDIAAVFKRLAFAGAKIVTLSEGTISELHIGLKGTMNALFLKDLADKTRRGRVEAGKSGGGNAYGYKVERQIGAGGEVERGERGERSIDEAQAAVVRRIFADYAAGISPRVIAKTLNSEGVLGPTGAGWGPSTIHGNKDRGTGILNNELYVGRLVWNRLRYIKNPETGKRVSRLNPQADWIVQEVPDLRITEQALWDKVKARQEACALGKHTQNDAGGFWDRRRPRFLLSGLVKCGCCGSGFVKISENRFGCANARNKGTCDNHRTIRQDQLENAVLQGLQHHLMDDELVTVFCEEYTRHLNTLRMNRTAAREHDLARQKRIIKELDQLVDALCDGVPASQVRGRMIALEEERAVIEARLANASEPDKPLLHPGRGARYRKAVADLRGLLASEKAIEAVEILRGLIDRITLHPDPDRPKAFLIDLEGDLAGILRLCRDSKKPAARRPSRGGPGEDLPSVLQKQLKLVAGAGFEPATFRL
ncbi:MAG: recombinase family protein [Rhodospirillaceae bacterium]|nr:recombinase family protein [Rhodospirillaceae bacterium]